MNESQWYVPKSVKNHRLKGIPVKETETMERLEGLQIEQFMDLTQPAERKVTNGRETSVRAQKKIVGV